MENNLTVRSYGEGIGDFQLVESWVNAHAREAVFAETTIPPVGVIVESDGEPVAACWLYLSAGIGVGFLEMPVTRPGTKLEDAVTFLGHALAALEEIARSHNYGVLMATTPKGIGHVLMRKFGYKLVGDRVQLFKRID